MKDLSKIPGDRLTHEHTFFRVSTDNGTIIKTNMRTGPSARVLAREKSERRKKTIAECIWSKRKNIKTTIGVFYDGVEMLDMEGGTK